MFMGSDVVPMATIFCFGIGSGNTMSYFFLLDLHASYWLFSFAWTESQLKKNYRGLKLQEQVMKVLENVLNIIIRE